MIDVRNVTLSLDESLLESAKSYAAGRGMSLNAFVKKLIERELKRSSPDWVDSFIGKAKVSGATSRGERPMTREEIYDR